MAEAATPKKAPANKKKTSTIVIIALAVVLVVGGVLLFLKVRADRNEELRQSIINSGTFHPGITVEGVDVSGMTASEAAAALKDAEQAHRAFLNHI